MAMKGCMHFAGNRASLLSEAHEKMENLAELWRVLWLRTSSIHNNYNFEEKVSQRK